MIVEKNITNYLLLAAFFVSCVTFAYLIGDLAVHLKTGGLKIIVCSCSRGDCPKTICEIVTGIDI